MAVKVRVEDDQALGALRPLDVAAYLRSRGWTEVPSGDDPLVAWEKSVDGDTFEVLVPLQQQWRDYPRRMKSVLDTLSEAEQRSQLAIMRDVAAVSFDVVRLRVADNAILGGTMFFEDAIHVASAGRGMMLSAACAAIQPRRAYHSRKPTLATKYVDGLRMGQTEVGSYVLTILSPVAPALTSRQLSLPALPTSTAESQPEPYERTVTQTLGAALGRLHRAASRSAATGALDAFEEAVPEGVSADLCEAMGLIRECTHVATFEVSIGWAPSRPPTVNVPSRFQFATDVLEIVREAGRLLRERTPVEDFELVGSVIDLSRPSEELHGVAIILGNVHGQLRKVSTELWGADWQIAHDAQEKTPRALLRCTGELHRSGNSFSLRHARDVTEVDP